jgi:hypothetical protein
MWRRTLGPESPALKHLNRVLSGSQKTCVIGDFLDDSEDAALALRLGVIISEAVGDRGAGPAELQAITADAANRIHP